MVADKERVWADVQRAENILEASGVKLVHRAQGHAFYMPGEDAIYLPEKNSFRVRKGIIRQPFMNFRTGLAMNLV